MGIFSTINSVYVLVGSAVLGALGGLLGSFAVLRKQGLLGDAVAHSALPGIALAFLLMEVKFLPGLLFGALLSGLLGVFFIYYLANNTKIKMDSAMASVLSVFFGLGILLLSYIQHQSDLSEQSGLDSFLFGSAAALLKADVIWMVMMFFVILLMILFFWKELKMFTFDANFSTVIGFDRWKLELLFMTLFVVAILMSLSAVGVVLTAALFITPAVSALLWSDRLVWVAVLSTLFGAFSGASGAYVSSVFSQMPTGPVIVIFSSAIFIFSFFFAPVKGIISRSMSFSARSRKIQMENVLARFVRDIERGIDSWLVSDYEKMGYRLEILTRLIGEKFLINEDDVLTLSDSGRKYGREVIEKHRLWEKYLVETVGVMPDHVHRDAEEVEHILTDEMVHKLKKTLKNPKKDPHGKPITPEV